MEEENSKGNRARRSRSRHLPEELQEKILVHLPVKSLHRFESVCKTWRSIFHSRPFIDSYGIHHQRLFYTAPDLWKMAPGISLELPINNNPAACYRRVECVFGPLSNGMYCITSHIREEYRDFLCIFQGIMVLCDPSTRHYKVANYWHYELHWLLVGKIPDSKPCRAQFGFCKMSSSSDWDYKVVVLFSYRRSLSSFIGLLYDLQSGEWKKIVEYQRGMTNVGDGKATEAFNIQGRRIIEICNPLESRPQRLLEGRWHWIAVGEDRSFNVLSFDFADEAFGLMGAPGDYVRNESCSVKAMVSVLHDRLVVIYLLYNELSHCVEADVWMMMEYSVDESWTKMCNINPNLDGDQFERHLGIEYSTRRDEESGCVRIESLSFSDFDKQQIDLML